MKRTGLILLCLLSLTAGRAQYDADAAWERANGAYVQGDYELAAIIYDSIRTEGYVSSKLYYNLGNAYFKLGRTGLSILNYNRALKISPSDPDTRHNLKIAETHAKDKIEAVPVFFMRSWIRSWRQSMSSDGWAVMSLVMFAAAMGLILLYLLSRRLSARKAGFYGALAALILAFVSVIFAAGQKNDMLDSGEAIVLASAVPVKSSPDNASKDIFIVHEGTKVFTGERLNHWVEITLADGNKGWILESAIEVI
ncbi:MAG: tetratricopeptide repeat protein [Rikenellaceae bacterium]|nr:tetratricopeptide repeat protein [Rikenellaceae bacterium]